MKTSDNRPKFGINGSVLNIDTMSDELRTKYESPSDTFWYDFFRSPRILSQIFVVAAVLYFTFPMLMSLEIIPSWGEAWVVMIIGYATYRACDGLVFLTKRLLRRS